MANLFACLAWLPHYPIRDLKPPSVRYSGATDRSCRFGKRATSWRERIGLSRLPSPLGVRNAPGHLFVGVPARLRRARESPGRGRWQYPVLSSDRRSVLAYISFTASQ